MITETNINKKLWYSIYTVRNFDVLIFIVSSELCQNNGYVHFFKTVNNSMCNKRLGILVGKHDYVLSSTAPYYILPTRILWDTVGS